MNRQFNWRQRRHNDWLWLRSPLWIQEAKKKHLDHTQKARLIRFHSSKIRCVNHRPCFGGASAIMWARGVNERAFVRCFFTSCFSFEVRRGSIWVVGVYFCFTHNTWLELESFFCFCLSQCVTGADGIRPTTTVATVTIDRKRNVSQNNMVGNK